MEDSDFRKLLVIMFEINKNLANIHSDLADLVTINKQNQDKNK